MYNILISTSGAGNANNLVRSLQSSNDLNMITNLNIIGINSSEYELSKSIAHKKYLVPKFNNPEYVNSILEIFNREKIDFFIPNHEFEIEALYRYDNQEILDKCFLPSFETVVLCNNKYNLNKKLHEEGIYVPVSINIQKWFDIDSYFDEQLVEKPAWCRLIRGAGSAGATLVYDKEHAKSWIEYWISHKGAEIDQFMLSEYLPFEDYHFFSLWKDGNMIIGKYIERLAYVCSKYTLTGTSSSPSVCKLDNDPVIKAICEEAVKCIDPNANGLFGIDLKCDSRHSPCITEINIGRFPRINPIFSMVGNNIAELFVKIGLGLEEYEIDEKLDDDIYYMFRDFDTEPVIIHAKDLKNKYTNLS